MISLGFDTSNYTTSIAMYGAQNKNVSRLLPVSKGALGLRQSDAVFAHVNALDDLVRELMDGVDGKVKSIGVSTSPRRAQGSYMPCFKVGEMAAKTLAAVLDVPCYEFSHQEGHLSAALVTTGNEQLFEREFLAWHLSGGTSELLHVKPNLQVTKIGGTTDISAGQLVDRTGVLLGIEFPAGRKLDSIAEISDIFKIRQNGLFFSLSGMENKVRERLEDKPSEIAGFVLGSIADIIARVSSAAIKEYGSMPIVISGGVAGSRIIRARMESAIFCEPGYSSDNALGIAALAHLRGALV